MITLYRTVFLARELENLISSLYKSIGLKYNEIISIVVNDDQDCIGLEVNWITYKKIISYLATESNILLDIILSSGNAQLHKCKLYEKESTPMNGMYIAIFRVNRLNEKLYKEIIPQVKNEFNRISEMVRKDLNSILSLF